MTATKLGHFQQKLLESRDALARQKARLADQARQPVGNITGNDLAAVSLAADTVGVGEGDEEVALGVYHSAEHAHGEVVAALERIAIGKYGYCDLCGKRIPQKRLEAIPEARRCATCATRPDRVLVE